MQPTTNHEARRPISKAGPATQLKYISQFIVGRSLEGEQYLSLSRQATFFSAVRFQLYGSAQKTRFPRQIGIGSLPSATTTVCWV